MIAESCTKRIINGNQKLLEPIYKAPTVSPVSRNDSSRVRKDRINNGNKLILLLTLVSFCLLPLEISNGAFTRITTYFTVFKIVSIPVIYSQISNKPLRIVLTSIFLLMLFFQYYLFLFVTDWSSVAWRNYHTMFELF